MITSFFITAHHHMLSQTHGLASPIACLWDDCSFPANHVTVYTLMEIEETLSVPYGVDFPAQEIRTARRIGDIDLINNPPENQKLLDPDKHSLDKKTNAKEKYKSVVESEDSIGR